MSEGSFERFARLPESQRASLLARLAADPVAGRLLEPSYVERRTWFMHHLVPRKQSFNMTEAFRVRGPLALPSLERAIQRISHRHDSLRTRFLDAGGRPVRLRSAEPIRLVVERPEIGHLASATDRAEFARALVEEEADRPFDLAAEPLLRCRAIVLGPDDHLLLFNMHHIISDGHSLGVFYDELATLYAWYASGSDAYLPPLRVHYGDYIARQRELTTGECLARDLAYWLTALAEVPTVLDLPTDRPRPARQAMGAALVAAPMPDDLLVAVRELAGRLSATPFMVLLAAYAVLLHRFTGQPDLLIGTPVAGRQPVDAEVIGLFVNTVVVRSTLADEPSFAEQVRRIRGFMLGAREHEQLPHDLLVDHLKPARDPSRNPLFQVFFAVEDNAADLARLGEAAVTRMDVEERIAARFDLSMAAVTISTGTTLAKLAFDPDLFDEPTIGQLLRCYLQILVAVTANPDVLVSDVDLIGSDPSRASILSTPPPGSLDEDDQEHTLHGRIAAQAKRSPAAPAIAWQDRLVSYAELDMDSSRLESALRGCGVRRGDIVGVSLRRDPRMVSALLAVLRAGAAYLPLDPGHPQERLSFMLADARATTLVIDSRYRDLFGGFAGTTVVLDEAHDTEIRVLDANARGPSDAVSKCGTADGTDLAYVLYTSGSTGKPKGVAVEHRSVLNLIRASRAVLGPLRPHAHLASSSISFDSSVSELFLPLATGGTVVLVDHLLDLIQAPPQVPVTVVETVPSLLRELLRRGGLPPSVTTLMLGGERLHADLVARAYASGSVRQLYNFYGPTESTVSATWTLVPDGCANPPIGVPLPGIRAYVLDQRGRPVPAGFPGELHLAGGCLARGYLNRPELTAQRFVTDVLQPQRTGALMYRTGDLVRLLPNGELHWLGRADRQVKIRGQRIELGEIEQALVGIAAVEAAAVCAYPDGDDLALCAYVAPPEAADLTRLRAALREILPGYLVPTFVVPIAKLPLTGGGKLDLAALPAPQRPARVPSRPPGTPTERAIAEAWCEALGVDSVGAQDDFFAVGGHSLLALQVIHQVQQRLGVRLDVTTMFEAPTVAGQAEAVESLRLREGAAARPDHPARSMPSG